MKLFSLIEIGEIYIWTELFKTPNTFERIIRIIRCPILFVYSIC